MTTFILASASPRRTELLKQAGIKHIVFPSSCEEVTDQNQPDRFVEDLSLIKAEDVFNSYKSNHLEKDFIVLGADTVVACQGKILGKPADADQARQMIRQLQNNTHQVYTGVTIMANIDQEHKVLTFHECSLVEVYPMTIEEIDSYIRTGDSLDKAGAYGIQGPFAVYIKGIRGDYNNIVGLPISRIYQVLKNL